MTAGLAVFKTVAARGLVNGRGPLRRSGRDSVLKTASPVIIYLYKDKPFQES